MDDREHEEALLQQLFDFKPAATVLQSLNCLRESGDRDSYLRLLEAFAELVRVKQDEGLSDADWIGSIEAAIAESASGYIQAVRKQKAKPRLVVIDE